MGLREEFLAYLEQKERETGLNKLAPPGNPLSQTPNINTPTQANNQQFMPVDDKGIFDDEKAKDRRERNYLLDAVGKGLWSFFDEAGLGVPGVVTKRLFEADEDRIIGGDPAETTLAKSLSAVGAVGGFIMGLPMKVGVKAATTVGKGVVKLAGAKTSKKVVSETIENIGTQSLKKSAQKVEKEIGNVLAHTTKAANWDAKIAKNWGGKVAKNVDQQLINLARRGVIPPEHVADLSRIFAKGLHTRSADDLMSLMHMRYGAKLGTTPITNRPVASLIGAALHEGIMFGTIDAVMETSHAFAQDREYDWTAPIWGFGVGAMFGGVLKTLTPYGKTNKTGEDFAKGLRNWFNRPVFQNQSLEVLEKNSRALYDDIWHHQVNHRKWTMHSKVINGEERFLSLKNPRSGNWDLGEAEYKQFLVEAMQKNQAHWGKELMKWAVKEDIKTSALNWKRMVGGAIIMNARMFKEMAQGHELENDDIMINILMGMALNRRPHEGPNLRKDIGADIRRARRNVEYLTGRGKKDTNLYDTWPTFQASHEAPLNVWKDSRFKTINEFATENNLVTNSLESVDADFWPGYKQRVGDVSKNYPLFERYMQFASRNSGVYAVDISNVPTKVARDVEGKIKELRNPYNENIKIGDAADPLSELISLENRIKFDSTEQLVTEIGNAFSSVMNESGGILYGDFKGGSGELGVAPKSFKVSERIMKLAKEGKIPWLADMAPEKAAEALKNFEMEMWAVKEVLVKTGKLKEIVDETKEQMVFDSVDALKNSYVKWLRAEAGINKGLAPSNKHSIFKFADVENLTGTFQRHWIDKSIQQIEKEFTRGESPSFDKILDYATQAGIASYDGNAKKGQRWKVLESIDDQLEIKYGDVEAGDQSGNYTVLKMISGLLKIRSGLAVDYTSKRTTDPSKVERLISFLKNDRSLPMDAATFESFGREMLYTIYQNLGKGTKLTPSQMDAIVQLSSIPGFRGASFGGPGVAPGFSVANFASISTDKQDKAMIRSINASIDKMRRDGSRTGDPNDSMIGTLPKVNLTDNLAIKTIYDILKHSRVQSESIARNELSNIIEALHPNNDMRSILERIVSDTNSSERVLGWLEQMGQITTSLDSQGMVKRVAAVNSDVKFSKEMEKKLASWLATEFAEYSTDISTLYTDVERLLSSEAKNYEDHKNVSKLTDAEFYGKYGFDTVTVTKEDRKRFIEDNITDSPIRIITPIANKMPSGELDKLRAKWPKKYLVKDEMMPWEDLPIDFVRDAARSIKYPNFAKNAENELNRRNKRIGIGKEIRVDAYKNLLDQAIVTYGGKEISALKLEKLDRAKFVEALGDVHNFITAHFDKIPHNELKLNRNNEFEATEKTKSVDPLHKLFSNMGLENQYGRVDKRVVMRTDDRGWTTVDAFQIHALDRASDKMVPLIEKAWTHWNRAANKYSAENVDKLFDGLAAIDFGRGSNQALYLPKSSYGKVAEYFTKEIYDAYKNKGKRSKYRNQTNADGDLIVKPEVWEKGLKRIEQIKDALDGAQTWGDAHELAMRHLIYRELLHGKDFDSYMSVFGMTKGEVAKMLNKRYPMLDAPGFTPINPKILSVMPREYLSKSQKATINHYDKKGVAKGMLWNDPAFGNIREYTEAHFKKLGTSWEEQLSKFNEGESAFDSMGFISKRKAQHLSMQGGNFNKNGHEAFKVIINSNGDHVLMFGKTAFFYNPKMDAVFEANPDLDFILTKSAAKHYDISKSENMLEVDYHALDKVRDISAIKKSMFEIPLENIGLKELIDPEALGTNSYAWHHFGNNAEIRDTYQKFFESQLMNPAIGMPMLAKIARDPGREWAHMMNIKKLSSEDNLGGEVYENGSMKHIGRAFLLAKLGGPGSQRMLGDKIVDNALFTKYLDPYIHPKGHIGGENYIKKKTISQMPREKGLELEPTVVKWSKDTRNHRPVKEVFPGEIAVDKDFGTMPVSYNKIDGMEITLLSSSRGYKPGSQRQTWQDQYIKLWRKKYGQKLNAELKMKMESMERGDVEGLYDEVLMIQSDGYFNELTRLNNLRNLPRNNERKIFSAEYDRLLNLARNKFIPETDLQVGLIVNRNPINKPQSITYLRLRGFDAGRGQAEVNPFDVWRIFDGDYDIDAVNILAAANPGMHNSIRRVADHWARTEAEDIWERDMPNISLDHTSIESAVEQFRYYTASLTSLKHAIGQSQKSLAQMQSLDRMLSPVIKPDLADGTKSPYNGKKSIYKYTKENGETVELMLDLSSDWYTHFYTSTQHLIDNTELVNKNLTKKGYDKSAYLHRFNYKENGLKSEEVGIEDLRNPKPNKKLILFRSVVTDKKGSVSEPELTEFQHELIDALLKPVGKFMELGTRVYNNTGEGKKAGYEDVIQYYADYKRFLGDPNQYIFHKLKWQHSKNPEFIEFFGMKEGAALDAELTWANKKKLQYEKKSEEYKAPSMDKLKLDLNKNFFNWYKHDRFDTNFKANAKEVERGDAGSLLERVFINIARRDPLKKYYDDTLLFGKDAKMAQSLEQMLMNGDIQYNVDDVVQFMPKITKDIKRSKANIIRWENTINLLKRNFSIPKGQREARIKGLTRLVEFAQADLEPLLSKEYKKTKNWKHLPDPKYVDIAKDRDARLATNDTWALWQLVDQQPSAKRYTETYKQALKKSRTMTWELFSEFGDAAQSRPYGSKTVHNVKSLKALDKGVSRDYSEIEQKLAEQLLNGFNAYGPSFIVDYMYKKPTELAWTIIGGQPSFATVSTRGMFKRGMRFLTDLIYDPSIKVEPEMRLKAKEFVEIIAKRWANYNLMMTNNHDLIDLTRGIPGEGLDGRGFATQLLGGPKISPRMIAFGQKHSNLKFRKPPGERNVFGTGSEYNAVLDFYENIIRTVAGDKTGDIFRDFRKQMTHIHQLHIESGGIHPAAQLHLMADMQTWMKKIGLDKKLSEFIQEDNFIGNVTLGTKLPVIHGWLGTSGGISFNPVKMLRWRDAKNMRNLIEQSKAHKNSQATEFEGSESRVLDRLKEHRKRGKCKIGDI